MENLVIFLDKHVVWCIKKWVEQSQPWTMANHSKGTLKKQFNLRIVLPKFSWLSFMKVSHLNRITRICSKKTHYISIDPKQHEMDKWYHFYLESDWICKIRLLMCKTHNTKKPRHSTPPPTMSRTPPSHILFTHHQQHPRNGVALQATPSTASAKPSGHIRDQKPPTTPSSTPIHRLHLPTGSAIKYQQPIRHLQRHPRWHHSPATTRQISRSPTPQTWSKNPYSQSYLGKKRTEKEHLQNACCNVVRISSSSPFSLAKWRRFKTSSFTSRSSFFGSKLRVCVHSKSNWSTFNCAKVQLRTNTATRMRVVVFVVLAVLAVAIPKANKQKSTSWRVRVKDFAAGSWTYEWQINIKLT